MITRIMTSLLFTVFTLEIQAAGISTTEIDAQEQAQKLCVQQRVDQCRSICNQTDDINCAQACEENAKNECRQAGE